MLRETFILECLSILILIQILQTSSESNNLQCNRSACGSIPVVSDPFRLKGDPKSCGDSSYELVCENNTASLYLNSEKYYVQAIDYQNFTIRLVHASLKAYPCSFPPYFQFQYILSLDNYPYSLYAYNSSNSRHFYNISWPINFMSCPYPINSSFFLETAFCGNRVIDSIDSYSSTRRYTYVKVGNLKASDVRDMCSIDFSVPTSWPFKNVNNISLSDIHSSLLYGFELSWFTVKISYCKRRHYCPICYEKGTARFCPDVSVGQWIRSIIYCNDPFTFSFLYLDLALV
ncbi:uncharacterized protein LOC111367444 [Olea europaea var. sylvestris]|uniref:uncharacterized protein LOC111367444 n=1 Tax=Olea europaea var. sylvestris TaxID=158386 RepID=UPI000C1CD53D|nr:uncharacterized protein LOC111367444 [Olea europaea var. sylvestris]